jgi:hypothetical protein
MDYTTITQQLAALKAQAAKINAEINTAPNREIKRLKTAEYMALAANIAELKNTKAQLRTSQLETKEENKKTTIKLANLYFPKEQRIQYFATALNIVDLMLLLEEVFETEIPAITAFFSVAPEQADSIPPAWYELLNEEDEKKSCA